MPNFTPLALKYRPQRFADVIGQEFAVKVLRKSVQEGKAYPSLVFYGHTGAGKTTLARLYAKALNCLAPENGEPCCVCESCLAIAEGKSLVYTEVDGASHGGVDNIRELGKVIGYKALGNCRVTTVDECHAISPQGWQAMLKFVEEPPDNVIFIFVTTEVEKIPDTIQSRCFAIPFRGVSNVEVVTRLADVARAEGITVESQAVYQAIVRRTGGAVRNALVMLDQARMTAGEGPITMLTLQPLGFCDPSIYADFLIMWKDYNLEGLVAHYRKWAPMVGPEAFLKGLEDVLYREVLAAVGVEAKQYEVRGSLGLTLPQLWKCIQHIWKVVDASNLDLGRVETVLIGTLLELDRVDLTPEEIVKSNDNEMGRAQNSEEIVPIKTTPRVKSIMCTGADIVAALT